MFASIKLFNMKVTLLFVAFYYLRHYVETLFGPQKARVWSFSLWTWSAERLVRVHRRFSIILFPWFH